jgi:hypothetical protein
MTGMYCRIYINTLMPLHLGRFKAIPSFSLQSIRPFPDNIADLSHCPAWFFEDVLQVWHTPLSFISNPTPKQCAMPVFNGLLPPKHNELVQTLLFRLAEWQTLTKFRLHTEDTLALLHQAL